VKGYVEVRSLKYSNILCPHEPMMVHNCIKFHSYFFFLFNFLKGGVDICRGNALHSNLHVLVAHRSPYRVEDAYKPRIKKEIFEINLKPRTSTWLQKADLLFVAMEHQNSADDEVVVEKPTTDMGIIFDPSFWEVSSCLED
jgi:hypothetical protein